jgi:hypothetical protein
MSLTIAEINTLVAERDKAQARAAKLYGVATAVKIGLAEPHQQTGIHCGDEETPCTLCWLLGEAEAALAALAEEE